MNLSYIINPLVTSGMVAAVAGLGMLWLVWSSRAALTSLLKNLFTRTAFFWLVNIVFMAISAYHAAPFFGSVVSTLPGLEWAAQYIGLPVALVIDGVTIVFMQARMEASYKRDRVKQAMYTRYVFAAAGLNTIANLYTDIQHFQASHYNNIPSFMLSVAPAVLSVFPMFLVAISKAADEMVNIKPLDKLNVEEFKAQEQKRVDILEAQADFLDKEAKIMERLIRVEAMQKHNELLRKGTTPKSFRWWWEKPFEIAAQDALIVDLQQQLVNLQSRFLETDQDTFEDTEEETFEDIKEYSPVNLNEPKETIRLVVMEDTQEDAYEETFEDTQEDTKRDTDKLIMINRKRCQSENLAGNNSDAVKRIRRILRRKPDIGPTELAEKTGVTKGYASRVKAQYLKEQMEGA